MLPSPPKRILSRFRFTHLKEATNQFHRSTFIATSAYGSLYRATLPDGRMVMVKRACTGLSALDAQIALENERHILSGQSGRHVLNLIGVSDDTVERVLVLDFPSNGTLFNLLHCAPGKIPLDWPLRLQVVVQIAQTIRGLHFSAFPIFHRNIQSSNIWIDHDWNAKLGGFEFAVHFMSNRKPIPGCPSKAAGWMDPDYQPVSHLCAKTDVYCFGLLILEVITGRKVIDVHNVMPGIIDWTMPLILKDKVLLLCDQRMRMCKDVQYLLLDIVRIAARCLNKCSSRRPSMADVEQDLRLVRQRYNTIKNGVTAPFSRLRDFSRGGSRISSKVKQSSCAQACKLATKTDQKLMPSFTLDTSFKNDILKANAISRKSRLMLDAKKAQNVDLNPEARVSSLKSKRQT